MPRFFVDDLPVSEEERQKILALGHATPKDLLAQRLGNQRAFDKYLTPGLVERILPILYGMLSETDRAELDMPSDFRPKFGALLK
jgi:hypothetical protein